MRGLVTTKAKIRELLYNHYEFGECDVEDVRWRDQGATIDLVINYIWSDTCGNGFDGKWFYVKDGKFRTGLDAKLLKFLRFHLVQEFHAHNWWTPAIDSPDILGQGASEMAAVRVVDDSLFLAKYSSYPQRFHHLVAFWEGNRRLDFVCVGIEVIEDDRGA